MLPQEEWNRDAFLEALVYYDRDVHREKTPAAYQDLVRQRQIRLKEVRDRGLDLYRLFAETLARGGFNAMICEDAATVSQRLVAPNTFFAIARTMNEEPAAPAAGSKQFQISGALLESVYRSYLLQYEAHLRRAGGLPVVATDPNGHAPKMLVEAGGAQPRAAPAHAPPGGPGAPSTSGLPAPGPALLSGVRVEDVLAEHKISCANCGVEHTPFWRRVKGTRVCNACGLHWNKYKTDRPVGPEALARRPAKRSAASSFGLAPVLGKSKKRGRKSRVEYLAILDNLGVPQDSPYRQHPNINTLPWVVRTYALKPLDESDNPLNVDPLVHMLVWLRQAARNPKKVVPPDKHIMEFQFDPTCRRLAHARHAVCREKDADDLKKRYWLRGYWMPKRLIFDGYPQGPPPKPKASLYPHRESRVGAAYQAVVPDRATGETEPASAIARKEGTRLWPVQNLGADNEWLDFFGPTPDRSSNSALLDGLGVKHMGIYDSEDWTAGEHQAFVKAFREGPKKNFKVIAEKVMAAGGSKDMRRCVGYYYNVWKQGCCCSKKGEEFKTCVFHRNEDYREMSPSLTGTSLGSVMDKPLRTPKRSDAGPGDRNATLRLKEMLDWLKGIGPNAKSLSSEEKGRKVRESIQSTRMYRARQKLWEGRRRNPRRVSQPG